MDNKTQELLADKFAKRFEDYNTKTLKEIAEVIKQFKGLNYTQAHKLAQQLKFDKSYTDLIDELSKLTGRSKKEIKDLLEEVAKQNIEFSDTFFKAKGMETPIYEKTKTLQSIVNAAVNMAGNDFINIAKSTGFRLLDRYNKPLYLNIKDAYYKVIDECVYAVNQGKDTFDNVMRKTINQLADSGVRKIEYSNDGKQVYSQRIDTAIRRNILDSIRQTTIETNEELGKKFDSDGWEITVHSEPAPDHMYVQGHQFTNEEFDKFNNDQDCVDVNGKKYPAESEETGRDRRSIGQYNCYHTAFPIIVGVSKPLYSDKELQKIIDDTLEEIEIDGKKYNRYEATQLQRQIETELRKHKEAQMMYKKTDDKEGMLEEQLKITQLTHKYKEISKKANIREQLNRASVSGYRPLRNKEEEIIKPKENIVYNVWDGDTIYLSSDRIARGKERLGKEIDIMKNKINSLTETTKYIKNPVDLEKHKLLIKEAEEELKKYEEKNKQFGTYKKLTLNSLEDCKELLSYNNINFKVEDFKEADFKLIKENTKQIYNLVNEYPIIRKIVAEDGYTIIGNNKMFGNIMAETSSHEMEINIDYFKDYNKLINIEKMQAERYYIMPVSDKNCDKYTITHEIGHLIDYKMRDLYGEKYGVDNYEISEYWHIRQFDNFLDYAHNKMHADKEIIYNQISGYGKSKPAEAIAELYASAKLSDSEIGKVFTKWLEEKLNEYD